MKLFLRSRLTRSVWIMCLLSISYLLAFMQRTGPGVIALRLQHDFHITAATLGMLSSIQYLLYMILQIPVGLSGDRFGPEKLLFSGVLFDGVGTLFFANAHLFVILLIGRAIVGLGDALIYVNIVLIIGRRFAPVLFGSMLGVLGTAGNIGAMLTTIPFAAWTAAWGWRIPFNILGILLVVSAFSDLVVLREPKKQPQRKDTFEAPAPLSELKAESSFHVQKIPVKEILGRVLRERNTWATFFCHFGAVGTYIGFVGLWAVPFFSTTYHLSSEGATVYTLVSFVGSLIGGPLAGTLTDRLGSRRGTYVVFQLLTLLGWASVVLCGGMPPQWIAFTMMFVIGLGSGASLLTFAVIRDQTPASRTGLSSGFANTGGFLSAVLLPVLFGGVIDALTHGKIGGSISASVYMIAFFVPILFSGLGVLGSIFIKEKPLSTVRTIVEA